MDCIFNVGAFNPQTKQLEEEFGLRTRTTPAPVESITKEDSNKCFKLSCSMILVLAGALAAIVFCRQYLASFLSWLAHLHGWHGPFLFCLLFVVVSFPMVWGYIILNLGAGYIYGLVNGLLLTILGANLGALVSFVVCRRLWREYVLEKLSAYDNLKQIVRVIEGRQGFKIIMMTRLTPVPFGLQNALFSTAKVGKMRYVLATLIGLLPTQVLNTYMGTTLRSMEDVMEGKQSSGIVLIAQVLITVAVSYIVNVRMKKEVHNVCEQESMARAVLDANQDNSIHRVLSMQTFPAQDTFEQSPLSVTINMEDSDSAPIAPLPEAAPTTAGGQFIRGHRRSQSAGSALKGKDYVIKLPGIFGGKKSQNQFEGHSI